MPRCPTAGLQRSGAPTALCTAAAAAELSLLCSLESSLCLDRTSCGGLWFESVQRQPSAWASSSSRGPSRPTQSALDSRQPSTAAVAQHSAKDSSYDPGTNRTPGRSYITRPWDDVIHLDKHTVLHDLHSTLSRKLCHPDLFSLEF